jgi:hypothetical protein
MIDGRGLGGTGRGARNSHSESTMSRIARTSGWAGLLGVMMGALGVLGAIAPTARAEVIIHDNTDGTFQWTRTIKFPGEEPTYGTYLDIRLSPTQSGERLPGTIGNWFEWGPTGSTPSIFSLGS